jgi:Spy/CpxP family protein refolding chaperone
MNRFDDIQDDSTPEQSGPPNLRSRRWIMAVLIAGSVAAAVGGSARIASAAQAVMNHHGGQHGAMDPAAMDRHVGEMVDRVLPDGTPGQKSRLAALVRSAHAEMAPFHAQLRQAHERAMQLLMQPRVDRAALEALRADEVRQFDAASQRLVQLVADAADTLTPEQRGRLFQHMQGRMH